MNVEEVKNAIAVLEQPLNYPGLIKRRNAKLVFRIWSYPALSAFVSFSILEDQDEYFLRRIIWDQRKVTFTAVTYGAEIRLSSSVWKMMSETLDSFHIPLLFHLSKGGIDGVVRGLETPMTKISWWSEAPNEWKELETWFENYFSQLSGLFPRSISETVSAI